eukprot:GHVS01083303.1.p2 GENE.GHVS01083303.1~~GHVS01083303.1.p2  ORF type:complete len:295 (+),score=80.72 GHVS01083303.1:288-1172(+)
MADTLPEPARHLAPYINRADELHEHCPMASFYCRLFVAEQLSLLRTQPSDAGVDKLLMDQLDKAEQLKALTNSNSDNPSVSPFTKQEFENFCLGVFKRANDDDQTGQISQSTLQRYFCAGIFLDVLGQFGPLSPEMEQKRKYSRWRATCIKRSLDKGETPPSPNDEEQEEGEGLALTDEFGKLHLSPKTTKPTTTSSTALATAGSPTACGATSPSAVSSPRSAASPKIDAAAKRPPPPVSVGSPGSSSRPRVVGGTDRALKHAQHAVSALNFDDAKTARRELHEALACLDDGDD